MSKYVYLMRMDNGMEWLQAYDGPVDNSLYNLHIRELGVYESLTEFLRYWQRMICFEAEEDGWYIGDILDDIGEEFEDDMCYRKAKKIVMEARNGED